MDMHKANRDREAKFNAEATAAGNECLTSREAARLFGVGDDTIRQAKMQRKIRPVFVLAVARDAPLYRLSDLEAYFADRSMPDPEILATMRENGIGCWMTSDSPGAWLLLTEKPGLRQWEDAA